MDARADDLYVGMRVRHDAIVSNDNTGVVSEIDKRKGDTLWVWLQSGQPLVLAVNTRLEVLSTPTDTDEYHVSNIGTGDLSRVISVRGRDGSWNGESIMDELHRRALRLNERYEALNLMSEYELTYAFARNDHQLANIAARDDDGVPVTKAERDEARMEAWLIGVVDYRRHMITCTLNAVKEKFPVSWFPRLVDLLGGDTATAERLASYTTR